MHTPITQLELLSSGRLKWACQLKAGDEVQVDDSVLIADVIRRTGTFPSYKSNYGLQFVMEMEITVNP